MAFVTQSLIDTWYSGQFVGENTPKAVVQVQRGYWQRAFRSWPGPQIRAEIWGEGGYGDSTAHSGYWFPEWTSTTDWIDLPNLYSIKRTRDFQQNGITVAEVVLDAQDYVPSTGAFGDAYHVVQPGQIVAERGVAPQPTRPDPNWPATEWTGLVTDSVKIRIWQGYGDPQTVSGNTPPIDGGINGAWMFSGQVDTVDLDSDPNTITLTARNGKLLTDERVFGWAKSKRLNDPITFFDNLAATFLTMVGSGADASSTSTGYFPYNVLDLPKSQWDISDPAYQTTWVSGAPITSTHLEWIDIRLPQGTYDEFWLNSLKGMFAYVGIYAHSIVHYGLALDRTVQSHTTPPRMDGVNQPVGWIDLGYGNAPGDGFGGWPWIRSFRTGQNPPPALPNIDRVHLGHSFDLGNRSILRVGFIDPGGTLFGQKAHVADLHGLRRQLADNVEDQRFILVPDVSEVVKVVLRWAGFQEWEVEESGVRIANSAVFAQGLQGSTAASGWLIFNRASFMIDIIKQVATTLGFIFFIADPTDANSDGVPTFRRDSSMLVDNGYVAADIRDTQMITGLKRSSTDADRAFIVRVRGKAASAAAGGMPLGGDTIKRIMAVYVPPWAYGDRTGGIVRHVTFQNDQLVTYAMCLMGCFLIALRAAQEMYTATLEIPAHPIIELDDQVSVIDEATATNSRLWVIKSEDTMQLGENASWIQTLTGTLMDTQDFWQVMNQVLGIAPVQVDGSPVYLNWNQITDPTNGQVSGYISPAVQGISRTPRTR